MPWEGSATAPPHRTADVAYVKRMDLMHGVFAPRRLWNEAPGILEEVEEPRLAGEGGELVPHLVVLVRGLELLPRWIVYVRAHS